MQILNQQKNPIGIGDRENVKIFEILHMMMSYWYFRILKLKTNKDFENSRDFNPVAHLEFFSNWQLSEMEAVSESDSIDSKYFRSEIGQKKDIQGHPVVILDHCCAFHIQRQFYLILLSFKTRNYFNLNLFNQTGFPFSYWSIGANGLTNQGVC